ncbi:hypothetical protein PFLUV_G00170430 [Perca fluviatilis]|uniref:Ig-like domain-containing protein n=1 Tax=Perca fluviatilis TaxID=8168 RepID=A0A6A5EXZ2_PERFL|nr:CD226 antigen-like [Perca fluviatilis]KAF1381053.1 hypothetical protein PFLUV_G00170430 [Perca fluviatilis]
MVPLALFFILLTVPVLDFSGDPHKLTLKPGEDVLLHCQVPRDGDIAVIVWSRPDQESQKYVLLYKENRTHEKYQLPSYRGRVELSDPEMKDGDVSVVLKNVSVNDTGTYECGVIISGRPEPEVINTITLNVTDSDPHKLTLKPGEDVLLHCQVPRDGVIAVIVWSRPDQESQKYVLLYKENRTHEKYQLPSYRGRVELSDPEMKDGDVSVVLKNVSVNDTGTYECGVIISGRPEPEVINTITLNVTDSGHAAGGTDGGDKDVGGILRPFLLPVIIVIFIALFVAFKKSSEKPVAAENEKNILFQDSTPFINPPTGQLTALQQQGIGGKYKMTL